MKDLLDTAVQESGAYPDIVFGAHVHNYQRFTRKIDDQEYTYIVAGAGGYWHLHSMAKFKGAKVTPPFRQVDDPDVILENYVDDTHGFMRVEIEDENAAARRRFVSITIQGQQARALSGRGASRARRVRLRRRPPALSPVSSSFCSSHTSTRQIRHFELWRAGVLKCRYAARFHVIKGQGGTSWRSRVAPGRCLPRRKVLAEIGGAPEINCEADPATSRFA